VDRTASSAYEEDYQRVVRQPATTSFLPGTDVEVIYRERRPPPEHVLFDFDGTLSLIREGWAEIMVPMMVEILRATGTAEPAEVLRKLAFDFVMALNGKQTIYQMIRLAEEVRRRGGVPEEPQAYKDQYHQRLMERIAGRREALRSRASQPAEMLVPHALELLAELRRRGAGLYLASGTDEQYVLEEARLLGLDQFFGTHIYGALADYKSFSKAMVIQRILSENQIDGQGLLGFGDGYVEIQNIKAVGGTAVAVASDEAGRSGQPDPWKRDRLIGVGADLVVPDYRDWQPLVAYLWGEC
jgi:phosphoglycolate phosphatase